MGITCVLRSVTEADLARLLDGELDLASFLFGEPEPHRTGGLRAFLSWLRGASSDPKPEIAPPPPAARDDELDIDKAWHGLHVLFTGQAEGGDPPAAFLIVGGEEMSEPEDHEIGLEDPARAFTAGEVRAIATFLAALTPAELARRYDPARMAKLKVYPDVIWLRPPLENEQSSPLEYLLEHFARLRAFVERAAARGEALVVYRS
jgi:hypothetical protein